MKATWFGLALCALAALPVACQRRSVEREPPACGNEGVVSSRRDTGPDGREIDAEIVTSGCKSCTKQARAGALPGSACGAASVCAEFCCDCGVMSPKLQYRARVCRAGSCADRETACESARASIHPDVCQAL